MVNVFELFKDKSSMQSAPNGRATKHEFVPNETKIETESETETEKPDQNEQEQQHPNPKTTQINAHKTTPASALFLIPEDRREEVRRRIEEQPELEGLLKKCRLGFIDYFTLMEKLGINPFPDAPQTSCLYCTHLRTPQVPTGNFCMKSGKPERLEWLNGCENKEEKGNS
ncbi:hypothetical protein [Desulfomonile tiedjei]|uniref:Uncharacterized protein n=1 Tax=Desulfomonile tiedjei (strain ATCC 49306 / DSM 6799 / DCB-1) TaxID=706587 RepID=I4C600_DESTA|nr:hypothetical protein [Desulfomonile tiedjei]AFM24991.1 hypothetical protein Desti_2303 [Desulfomonile tiedjei DSM 6799]